MLRMRILSEFKAEGWLPRKLGFHSPVALMPLAFNSHSLRKHFFLPPCFIPNLPRYKQWKRWSPLSTAAQDCLFSLVSQFFLPLMILATSYPPQLASHRCCQPGEPAGPRLGTRLAGQCCSQGWQPWVTLPGGRRAAGGQQGRVAPIPKATSPCLPTLPIKSTQQAQEKW